MTHGIGTIRWIPGSIQEADWLTKVKSGAVLKSRELVNKVILHLVKYDGLRAQDVANDEADLGRLLNPNEQGGNPAINGMGAWGANVGGIPAHFVYTVIL